MLLVREVQSHEWLVASHLTKYARKYVNNDDDDFSIVYVYVWVKNVHIPTHSWWKE